MLCRKYIYKRYNIHKMNQFNLKSVYSHRWHSVLYEVQYLQHNTSSIAKEVLRRTISQ